MSLFESLQEQMNGKPYVGYFAAYCVFETHKSAALLVYPDGFYCRSCHKRGSLDDLAKKVDGGYVPEREYKVTPHFRRWLERFETLDDIAYSAQAFLKSHPPYQKYLRNRKAEQWIGHGLFGFREGWITIPVRDEKGDIVNIICRGIGGKKERYVLLRIDKEPRLYVPDWKHVLNSSFLYVVFGIFDAWTLWELGLPVVSGTTGTSLPPHLLRVMMKDVIIVPDKGEESSAYDLANKIGWRASVKTLRYPAETKDPDEIRRKFGNRKLHTLLEA